MKVDISDQEQNVSLVVSPKKSLIIQKLASFTWEQMHEPAPVASVRSGRLMWVWVASIGITSPAVEMAATVAEPRQIRKSAAIPHAAGLD